MAKSWSLEVLPSHGKGIYETVKFVFLSVDVDSFEIYTVIFTITFAHLWENGM